MRGRLHGVLRAELGESEIEERRRLGLELVRPRECRARALVVLVLEEVRALTNERVRFVGGKSRRGP